MFTLRWWHVCMTDMSGPGPAFSWIVLVAILGFGLVALWLLTAGQCVRIGAPAVGLAIGTVLIGMTRAREHRQGAFARERAPGGDRPAHRSWQPPASPGPA